MGGFLASPHPIISKQGLSVNVELTSYARLALQHSQDSATHLSPPPQDWTHGSFPTMSDFLVVAEAVNSGLQACAASPLPLEPSPQLKHLNVTKHLSHSFCGLEVCGCSNTLSVAEL